MTDSNREDPYSASEDLEEKVNILTDMRIYKAINYVLISKDLIIDKMNELIYYLKNDSNVTYEKVKEYLEKVLKTKSTVKEVGNVKNALKSKLLVKILKKQGKVK